MIGSDGESIDMFKAMAGFQIGAFLICLIVGGWIAVISHQFIFGVFPVNVGSAIIEWSLAIIVGYVVGGGFGAIIIVVGVFWLMLD